MKVLHSMQMYVDLLTWDSGPLRDKYPLFMSQGLLFIKITEKCIRMKMKNWVGMN